ncbi:MAG: hypothetical protein MRY78_10610 [Saprospiraceae bacterium]|nr:hypothetical protein [Saprospiraceae bacterium]
MKNQTQNLPSNKDFCNGAKDNNNPGANNSNLKKRRKIADTSIESHHEEIRLGSYLTQSKEVISILSDGIPRNYHEIHELMKVRFEQIEKTSTVRAISNLRTDGVICIDDTKFYTPKGKKRGKRIRYYKLVEPAANR